MKGQWVACEGCDAPIVTGQFPASGPREAVIDICGLGFFELYLNEEKVSSDLLTPVWTDYSDRAGQRLLYPLHDRMRHRVCFLRWPLQLREGLNRVEVLLGNGWYNQRERNVEGDLWYGDGPCLRFEIRWREGEKERSFESGPHLKWRPSAIIQNNVYTGETQDLRLLLSENGQKARPVSLCAGPDGALEMQRCPPDRIIRSFAPALLSEEEGKRIYDAGHNLTGWVSPLVCGVSGERVTLRYAETLNEQGQLDFTSCGRQIQTDTYICSGEKTRCRPHFTWHGFRYVEITGPAEAPEVQQVHADVGVTGSFSCSDPVLNRLMDAYVRTRLNNMHCGVPSDCPHRERLGYTGDGQAVSMTDMYVLDGDLFYRKWIRDILDCQDPDSGHVQHTAPFYGGGGGPGGWGGAVVLTPWAHYRRYGDLDVLLEAWPHMKKWADYMRSRMDEKGLVVREEEGGWCLGDWCAPEKMALPESFVNTCLLARCLEIMARIAQLLKEDAQPWKARWEAAKAAVASAWWDGEHFAGGIQGADALALEAGLGGQALADAMDAHYRAEPWFDTGFLASGSVIRQLFRFGHADTALAVLASKVPGHSFGWQQEMGADTLWERWDGQESRDHPMFGGVVESLFSGLAGISLEDKALRPVFPRRLNQLSCQCETRFGKTAVAWKRENGGITLHVLFPVPGILQIDGRNIPLEAGKQVFHIREPLGLNQ